MEFVMSVSQATWLVGCLGTREVKCRLPPHFLTAHMPCPWPSFRGDYAGLNL
ncbi:hypothetical protein TRIATDRAFT_260339 [Trichoderma atroviride IMI 206040]|uniref:Uncharacterized protein n=1 Tax=Hypocrea atroviridis (strain ATCC 20476 / IMI 206040) TaxID=452589 RepID=G9PBF2_HYPAI|nr:uncharacterized protein TRIATDRAFT_260339 [Trichoderma atroviride IMI 206040]EHK39699.1 hypothetical protein TRIATDRAFT_260339 [Trichoderma atroviride IMI 206040]